MSLIGDVLGTIRKIVLIDYRVEEISKELAQLQTLHDDTRARVLRLETIIEEARRAAELRRLSPPS